MTILRSILTWPARWPLTALAISVIGSVGVQVLLRNHQASLSMDAPQSLSGRPISFSASERLFDLEFTGFFGFGGLLIYSAVLVAGRTWRLSRGR